jgi:CysZ protein
MILTDFLKALGQIGDPRFLRVVLLGIALSLALLVGLYLGLVTLIGAFVPASVTLPWLGEVGGLTTVLDWGSALLVLVLSVFLMAPAASAFSALFLDSVAEAVEARHYPHLPPPRRLSLTEGLRDALSVLAILLAVNLVLLVSWVVLGPLAALLGWGVNGYLLGREYFLMTATRRLGRTAAAALLRRHGLQVWLAGSLMAAPLSLPLINLIVPVLGVATFTHLMQRLSAKAG